MRRNRVFRWLILILFAFAAVFTIAPQFEGIPRAIRRWLIMGAVMVVLLPWFCWELFFPPPIELTAFSNWIDYEFSDRAYAEEFAALNNAVTDADDDDKTRAAEER
jgi:hypothetical protein